MISIYHVIRGDLILAPMVVFFWIAFRRKVRELSPQVNEIPDGARKLFGYKVGLYLCILLFCVMLSFWIGAIVEVGFDWNWGDVAEMEIVVFQSPNPAAKVTQVISVKDDQKLTQLCDSLAMLKSFQSSRHVHAVGQCYALRLRRKSDGQWSSYQVRIYPDSESNDGAVLIPGVHKMALEVGRGKYYFGRYQVVELGKLVEQLVQSESK